ncbi:MAG TPA: hypothetical protein VEY49_01715 [Solirubrobacteraceae bacterium]|nr:hypothetical protein [Solirubrobacteraceae bacterium]
MTSATTTAPPRRVLLLPVAPRAGRNDASLRRYRLARLRVEDRDIPRAERFRRADPA